MTTRSMMAEYVKMAGKIPVGNYVLKLRDVLLKEDVSVYHEKIPEGLRGKEKNTLTEEQVKLILAVDLGKDGVFENGQAKPRFQNQIVLAFYEVTTGKEFPVTIYGGPALSAKAIEIVGKILGLQKEQIIDKSFGELFKPEYEYNVYIGENDKGYNKLDQSTIRRVGLPPLAESGEVEKVNDNGFNEVEQKLLNYLMGEGKGIQIMEIQKIAQNKPEIGDLGTVMKAWNTLKTKVQSYATDGKIDIVLKA